MKNWYCLIGCIFLIFGARPVFSQESSVDFYTTDSIQQLDLRFEADNWRFILDSLRYNGDEMLQADLTINGQQLSRVGVRIRDSRAFKPGDLRNSLHIQLNYELTDQNYQGYQSIKLSSALRDPSLVREVLGYEIARNYMPAPRANYAKLVVNDEYYGLMVNVEPTDGPVFLNRNFGQSEGDLFLSVAPRKEQVPAGCANASYGALASQQNETCFPFFFKAITGNSFDALSDLASALDTGEDKLPDALDIDRTLWMHAFNNVVANLNSYSGQNTQHYMLFKPTTGPAVPMVWNLNLAFGSFKNTGEGSDLKPREMVQLDPLLHARNGKKPLISVLLQNDTYRKMYLAHVRTILNDHFVNGAAEERSKELQEQIRIAVLTDRNRYYTRADFENSMEETIGKLSKIPGLGKFIRDRASWLKKTDEMLIIPPNIEEVTYKERAQFSRERIEKFHIQVPTDRFTKRVMISYRLGEEGPFQTAYLKDDGNSFDEKANDQIFGIVIDPKGRANVLEYFIMAENARAVSFSPHDYMQNKHIITLTDLN